MDLLFFFWKIKAWSKSNIREEKKRYSKPYLLKTFKILGFFQTPQENLPTLYIK